ncbi:hypothetical protein [Chryseobacterium sp. SL1]|uniref:hypothetical protein n=1 Tax=Chryseobacterium sp. SL1 TaxID=2995159 RepID=UPI0022743F19|nr:hypothetical protein [Chryseobacterium sp. SL1]MCY1660396.1 hypothetical protein [Chryseobacterium sp. SL1]
MPEEKELTVISDTDFYKLITLEFVYEAIEFVQRKNIELKKSTKYSLLVGGKTYPPKEIMRFMAQVRGYEIIEESLFGGNVNKPFKKLGLIIINNSENHNMTIKDLEPI